MFKRAGIFKRAGYQGDGKGEGGQCEKSWEQLRNSMKFIKETTEKWQDLADAEERRLEREGRKMGQEILKKRKEKFGKVGGRKLTVLEEVILRNQTRKKSELAEVEQNIKREQNRRKGKRMERLEPEEIPEGRKRQEEDEIEERVTELDEEGHWKNLMAHRDLLLGNQKWMSAGRMEASSLEEQRLLAYGKKQEVSQKDVWKFWEVKAGSQAKHDVTVTEMQWGQEYKKDGQKPAKWKEEFYYRRLQMNYRRLQKVNQDYRRLQKRKFYYRRPQKTFKMYIL
jgi:hypothetical protein